jgi:hypothetical protein
MTSDREDPYSNEGQFVQLSKFGKEAKCSICNEPTLGKVNLEILDLSRPSAEWQEFLQKNRTTSSEIIGDIAPYHYPDGELAETVKLTDTDIEEIKYICSRCTFTHFGRYRDGRKPITEQGKKLYDTLEVPYPKTVGSLN